MRDGCVRICTWPHVRDASSSREPPLTAENMTPAEFSTPPRPADSLDVVFDALGQASDEALLFFDAAGALVRECGQASALMGTLPKGWDELSMWVREDRALELPFEACRTVLALPNGHEGQATMRTLRLTPNETGTLVRVRVRPEPPVVELQALLEAIPVGLGFIDAAGRVVHVNTVASAWLGLRRSQHVEQWDDRVELYDDTKESLGASGPLVQAVRDGVESTSAYVCAQEDDMSWRCAELTVSRVDDEGTGWIFLLWDVTAQREKDARRDEMLSIASHELRNPLTPLKGLLQIALQQRERDEDVDGSLLRKAEHQVQRLGKLVDGLLDLSRVETGRLVQARTRIDLGKLVLTHVSSLGEARARTHVRAREGDVFVLGAASNLEQVVGNLLDNALKYSPNDTLVSVGLEVDGPRAVLTIEDHGVGMSEEERERVFERFYRAPAGRAKVGGLGLGLYITRRIIQEHDGLIQVSSELGCGTVVEVSLPVTD